jgi:uncharacterized protein
VTARFRGLLDAITRVRGVRGAMIVASEDGLMVADALMEGVRGKAVAALASNLYKKLHRATARAGIGGPKFVQLQAAGGALLVLAAGTEMLLVAVTDPNVNVGLVRLEMLRATEVVA